MNFAKTRFSIGNLVLMLLIFLFIAVLAFAVSLLKNQSAAEERFIESFRQTHDNLVSVSMMLENQINTVYYQLTLDYTLKEWLVQPKPTISNMAMLGEIQNNSLKIISSNPLVLSVYIYSKGSSTVLATNHEFTSLEQFPDKELFTQFNEKNGHWIGKRPEKAGYGNPKDILTFVAPLGDNGLVAINVDERKLFAATPDASYGMMLVGKNGGVLTTREGAEVNMDTLQPERLLDAKDSSNQPIEAANQYVLVSDHTSGEWTFISVTPQIKLSPAWKQRQIELVCASALLAGLAVWIYALARRIYFQPIRKLETHYNKNLEDLKHHFTLNVLTGKLKESDIRDKLAELSFRFPSDRWIVVLFQIDNFYNYLLSMKQDDRFFMDKTIYNAIKWTFMTTYSSYPAKTELEKVSILISVPEGTDESTMLQKLEQTICYLQKEIEDNCSLTVCAGISRVHESLNHAHTAYHEALKAVSFKAIYGKRSIIRYVDVAAAGKTDEITPQSADIDKLCSPLKEGKHIEFEANLRSMLQGLLREERFSIDRVNAFFSNVLYGIVKVTLEHRLELADILHEDVFMKMYSHEFVQDKTEYVIRTASAVSTHIMTTRSSHNKTVRLVLDYIDAHFDEPISLTTISETLGINSSYISTLMKQELGHGFVEHLNQLRIKKALELLENPNLAIKTVSEMCGYDTVHSFIRNFKKLHLFTPSEYRSKILAKR
ncbi:helix-turn-helix domain-containing protein [Paenibacillus thalictri]|uniref:AraC family transcriptional regulator n=1 Tax=Paenibacillus thalictri TaxID=2527873 RepID=A0A4Q9DM02_9BACL|nr:helix-turn-helix domain-containing protein [Paenibacillus thalictri]TBL76242.1 AraC family transcriptional regulator [Paenibacillus thalictri]